MLNSATNNDAREAIIQSIRSHLAASAPHDACELTIQHANQSPAVLSVSLPAVELFKQNLEAVDGQCIIARDDAEIAAAVTRITRGKRTAISDAPGLDKVVGEFKVVPPTNDLFGFDVGISTAQAAIAETGTLVLDSASERHRLVSLVPPLHIAIVDAARIYLTLGETLSVLQSNRELSPTITFITGPSRTADIELTLALGVHGPQELYVIINQGSS